MSVAWSPAVLVSIGSAAVEAVSGFDGNAIGNALNSPVADEDVEDCQSEYTRLSDHAAAAGTAVLPNADDTSSNQMQTVAAGGSPAALLPSRGSVWHEEHSPRQP